MDLDPQLKRQLTILTAGLDEGADLEAILDVLEDDLRQGFPSFIGLEITAWEAGTPVTLSTVDAVRVPLIRASLLLPLDLMGVGSSGSTLVYYAAAPGVFVELAAAIRMKYELDGQVVVDRHLHPTGPPGLAGLEELIVVNQAVGVLIGQGHTLDRAQALLRERATHHGCSPHHEAQRIVDAIGPGGWAAEGDIDPLA